MSAGWSMCVAFEQSEKWSILFSEHNFDTSRATCGYPQKVIWIVYYFVFWMKVKMYLRDIQIRYPHTSNLSLVYLFFNRLALSMQFKAIFSAMYKRWVSPAALKMVWYLLDGISCWFSKRFGLLLASMIFLLFQIKSSS